MSIQQICELLKTGEHENIRKARGLVDDVRQCTSAEVDMLLERLNAKTDWEIYIVLDGLKWAETDHVRIVAAIKPLLRHENFLVVSHTLELCSHFGDKALELGPAILSLLDALIEINKTEPSRDNNPACALEALATISVNSKTAMRLVKKLNWRVPDHYDDQFDAHLLHTALRTIGRHGDADREFTESTLLRMVRVEPYGQISQTAFQAMLTLAPHWPAMLQHCMDSFRIPAIAESSHLYVNFLLASSLEPATIMSLLLNPVVPIDGHSLNDYQPKGFDFVRSEETFPKCLPVLEHALKGSDFDRFKRAAMYLTLAAPRFPVASSIIREEAQRCEQNKFSQLLHSVITLDTPKDELLTILKRATDNNWTSPEIDAAIKRIQTTTSSSSLVPPGWTLRWSTELPGGTEAEDIIMTKDRFCVNYRHILEPRTNISETNCETFGVYLINLDGLTATVTDAPLGITFPRQPTGGNHIRRRWNAEFAVNNDIFFVMKDPYYESSWGERTLIYILSLNNMKWSRLSEQGQRTPLTESERPADQHRNAIGHGQVVVWPEPDGSIRIFKDQAHQAMEPKDVESAELLARKSIDSIRLSYEADVNIENKQEFEVLARNQKSPSFRLNHFDELVRQVSGRGWDTMRVTSARWTRNNDLAIIITVKGVNPDKSIAKSFVLFFGWS